MLGFLLPMRRLRERMASLGCTVLLRMTSEISRLSAMSSLHHSSVSDSPLQVRQDTGHVQARGCGPLNLLIQGAIRRAKPARHGEREDIVQAEAEAEEADRRTG